MPTLRDVVYHALDEKVAIGHFDVSDSNQFQAVLGAVRETRLPAIIGVSEGERHFIGLHEIAKLVELAREYHHLPVYLNADHTTSYEHALAAIEAGFDAVLFDGSKLSAEENREYAKKVVRYARDFRKRTGRDVVVEGELGYIGSGSDIKDVPEAGAGASHTTAQEASAFVDYTGIDFLAPSVGSIHGLFRNAKKPRLNIERIQELATTVHTPLVLHGGSGNTNDDFRSAIAVGIGIVHINTELRVAYRKGIEEGLASDRSVNPQKYLQRGIDNMRALLVDRMTLFGMK